MTRRRTTPTSLAGQSDFKLFELPPILKLLEEFGHTSPTFKPLDTPLCVLCAQGNPLDLYGWFEFQIEKQPHHRLSVARSRKAVSADGQSLWYSLCYLRRDLSVIGAWNHANMFRLDGRDVTSRRATLNVAYRNMDFECTAPKPASDQRIVMVQPPWANGRFSTARILAPLGA